MYKKVIKGKGKLLVAGLIGLTLLGINSQLKTTVYTLKSNKIKEPITLVLLTDLHGCHYGDGQSNLTDAIAAVAPDAVLMAGDIFDDKINYDGSKTVIEWLDQRYPSYYVSGNHEVWSGEMNVLKAYLKDKHVTVLEGEGSLFKVGSTVLNISGVDDISFKQGTAFKLQLNEAYEGISPCQYSILLSHRPERISDYEQYDFDLIVAGHAHGGQWRLPGLVNGVFAPNQGILPKYAGGLYHLRASQMIVSRGLAKESTRIPRFFNRPELVVIELRPVD